jgi:hypothetical protein
MGKGSGGSSWGEGGSEAVSFAPVQIGAESSADSFRPEWFESAVNGLYEMIKTQVVSAYDQFGDMSSLAGDVKKSKKTIQGYEEKMSQIADTLLTSFATAVKPDEMKSFPLDKFVQSSIQEVYSKAKGIYDKPIMDRNEIKAIVDANAGNLASSFREQRRGIEQEIQARGLSGPAAAAARDEIERGIASGRDDIMRSVLGTQTANKYNTQLSALGTMQGATAQAEQVSTDYANRWLNQWGQKINAQNLMLQGQLGALGAAQSGAATAQQQYSNNWNMMNYPAQMLGFGQNFLGQVNQQVLDEYGKHVAAYGGAGSSSSWQKSEGSTPGQYTSPLNLWGGWST